MTASGPETLSNAIVYLDGHATTPLAPEAGEAMVPWWHALAANSHSPHGAGQRAAIAVEAARGKLGTLIGAAPSEIVFTSGATEANAIAIIGTGRAALTAGDARRRIVVSAIEHKSVLESASQLVRQGFEVVQAPVTGSGVIDLIALERLVDDQTLLVSVMAANNEVGVVQPLQSVAGIVRLTSALLHVDASQQVGKLPLDLGPFDLASVSSHKMYGPVGVGALFVSSACPLRPEPLFGGGGQEQGLRPGTLPVPLIVGFGRAAALATERLASDRLHASRLADRFISVLRKTDVLFEINGLGEERLPGSLSLRLTGCDAASLIARLSQVVAVAEGSACTSGQIRASHVLTAMGLGPAQASETLRIFCGRYTTEADVDQAVNAITAAVRNEMVANWTVRPVGSADERRPARV